MAKKDHKMDKDLEYDLMTACCSLSSLLAKNKQEIESSVDDDDAFLPCYESEAKKYLNIIWDTPVNKKDIF
jgi:hypothetical protein